MKPSAPIKRVPPSGPYYPDTNDEAALKKRREAMERLERVERLQRLGTWGWLQEDQTK